MSAALASLVYAGGLNLAVAEYSGIKLGHLLEEGSICPLLLSSINPKIMIVESFTGMFVTLD